MFCRLPRGGRRIHGKMFTRVQTSWLRPLLEIQMLSLTQTTDTSSDLDKQTDVRVSVMISDSKTVTQYLIMQMINVTQVKFSYVARYKAENDQMCFLCFMSFCVFFFIAILFNRFVFYVFLCFFLSNLPRLFVRFVVTLC